LELADEIICYFFSLNSAEANLKFSSQTAAAGRHGAGCTTLNVAFHVQASLLFAVSHVISDFLGQKSGSVLHGLLFAVTSA
jgi:hypothetical protein